LAEKKKQKGKMETIWFHKKKNKAETSKTK